MRSKILALAAVVAAALVASSVASAVMHPTLGARLYGMGHHGIVNLQAHAAKRQLCWTFDLNLIHAKAATIRDAHGMIVARLGHMYRATGCAIVSKQSLNLIETKPASYFVWVATAGHPGEVRGRLFAGMAHM